LTVVAEHPGLRGSAEVDGTVPGPTFGRLIRGELLKVRTTNLWWILALCAVVATGLALLVNGLIAHTELADYAHPNVGGDFAPDRPPSPDDLARAEAQYRADHPLAPILVRSAANIFTSGQFFGLLIVMLLGAIIVTGEYHNQTATTTFLAAPRRTLVILAKVAAAAILAAIAWFVTTVLDLALGSTFFAVEGYSNSLGVWDVQRAIGMNLPAYALWALLGMGLGALIRNQIATTLVGAGLYLIGGQVVQLAFIAVYSFWIKEAWVLQSMVALPAVASSVMISPQRVQLWSTDNGTMIYAPPWWVGGLVMVGYGIIATAVGTLFVRRRDIS
jgi:ABC-type transport system involved in multi-copper enzyme maturation permease subunit